MRRSSAVKLTLLPMLASAAVAAQPAPDAPPLQQPGETEPTLSPPGLTPTIDECQDLPDDLRCPPEEPEEEEPEQPLVEIYGGDLGGGFGGYIHGRRHHHHHAVFRGGFGHYAWGAGG
ncbi:MAG TPA: hypothetical protein VHW23_02440 [Kofleriaceae bacterium]|nr:hypothetical protein [Kofleriaceae bacterium]